MINLHIGTEVDDFNNEVYYIYSDKTKWDSEIADEMEIQEEKYRNILEKYGADNYAGLCDLFFKTWNDAQKCIDYLNKGTYIKDTSCICEFDDTEDSFAGSEGVYHEKKDNKWYFVIEHFRNERDKAEINYCPYCGKKLE